MVVLFTAIEMDMLAKLRVWPLLPRELDWIVEPASNRKARTRRRENRLLDQLIDLGHRRPRELRRIIRAVIEGDEG